MTPQVDDDVLLAAQAGDEAAITLIWRELSPAVVGYLAARGVQDPEAVAGDVFVTVLRRMGRLDGGAAGLRTFVFSVAHARFVDVTRRRRRRPDPVEFEPELHETSAGVSASAEDDALDGEGAARVVQLLQDLPDDHREVLALRVVGDLSLEQTATVMRRSVGAVKQLQRRALLTLRARVEAEGVTRRAR